MESITIDLVIELSEKIDKQLQMIEIAGCSKQQFEETLKFMAEIKGMVDAIKLSDENFDNDNHDENPDDNHDENLVESDIDSDYD